MPQVDTEASLSALIRYGGGIAVATGRFEARDDGVVAEVFEVRP
jgi:hypothetical protein